MNTSFAKQVFAISYVIFLVAVAIIGIRVHMILKHSLDLSWAGLFLVCLPTVFINGDALIKRSTTGHRYLPAITISVLLGFVVTVWSLLGGLDVGRGAFVAAVAGILAFAAYRFWYLDDPLTTATDQSPAT